VLKPNPAKGTVVLNLPLSNTAASLTLIDMTGKEVKSISLSPNVSQTTLDLTTLLPGVYIVIWRDGSQVYKQTLICR
jgi:hypothetical protein